MQTEPAAPFAQQDRPKRLTPDQLTAKVERGERLSDQELADWTEQAAKLLRRFDQRMDIWKHVKSGVLYKIVEPRIVLHENDSIPMVLYRPNEGMFGREYTWARRLDAFLERFVPVQEVKRWEEV